MKTQETQHSNKTFTAIAAMTNHSTAYTSTYVKENGSLRSYFCNTSFM